MCRFNRSKWWHIHLLTDYPRPPLPLHPNCFKHTQNTPINRGGDKCRGVKIHHCLPLLLPPPSPPPPPPPHHHHHEPLTLFCDPASSPLLLLLSVGEECVSLTTSFLSLHLHVRRRQTNAAEYLVSLTLSSSCFGCFWLTPCLPACVCVCANR